MANYLGKFNIHISDTKFKDYTPFDWAMYIIEQYGQYDGAHHKAWVIDTVARIYNGSKIFLKVEKWDNGRDEFIVGLENPSKKHIDWVASMKDGEDGEDTYSYYEGIAP